MIIQSLKNLLQVAWLHSEKGIIAVFPDMVAQNDRFSSTFDNRYGIIVIQQTVLFSFLCLDLF